MQGVKNEWRFVDSITEPDPKKSGVWFMARDNGIKTTYFAFRPEMILVAEKGKAEEKKAIEEFHSRYQKTE